MIRTIIALLVIALVAAVALAAAGDAGSASLVWLGWRIDTSASVVLVAVALGALAATLFWRAVLWFLAAPARAARARAEARRREGAESLARGFVAVAAGAGSDARRLAQKAADYIDDQPVLVRILAATAAEAAGDEAAAHAAYTAMLGFPELRLAGRRGLMLLAQRKGDAADAVRHAEAAYNLTKTARWAWRALLEARLAAGDWDAALTLAKDALDRKIVSPVSAERTRAALLAASAARREMSADPKALEEALDLASQAAKLRPDFTPGVLTAARRLAADGRGSRAAQLIEAAWKVRPHPGLAIAYRDLVTSETPRERARRLAGLADILPTHHESRILMIEQALLTGDITAARSAAEALDGPDASARVCGVMARLALAAHESDEARGWIARAAVAAVEPDWSDIDPEGRVFAYGSADWSRLVSHYAETGELIHPRLERGERILSELPDLPVAYTASTPFFAADRSGELAPPIPDDPGPYDEPTHSAPRTPAPASRRRRTTR